MNIGFYGHSAGIYDANSHNNIPIFVRDILNCNIVHSGVPQSSIERILFELKKSVSKDKIDIAIIFYEQSFRYFFVPKLARDFAADVVPENKANMFWTQKPQADDFEPDANSFMEEFYDRDMKKVFASPKDFINAMRTYKQYFYHQDLQRNRAQSAMLMIDTLCANKNINVIHVTKDPKDLGMPWFSFKSGVLSTELQNMYEDYPAPAENDRTANGLGVEGSKILADKIVNIITTNGWVQNA